MTHHPGAKAQFTTIFDCINMSCPPNLFAKDDAYVLTDSDAFFAEYVASMIRHDETPGQRVSKHVAKLIKEHLESFSNVAPDVTKLQQSIDAFNIKNLQQVDDGRRTYENRKLMLLTFIYDEELYLNNAMQNSFIDMMKEYMEIIFMMSKIKPDIGKPTSEASYQLSDEDSGVLALGDVAVLPRDRARFDPGTRLPRGDHPASAPKRWIATRCRCPRASNWTRTCLGWESCRALDGLPMGARDGWR